MRRFVYFSPCIALLVGVAVATAVTTLMYLSPIPLSSLIVSSPPFCPRSSCLVLRFGLFYIISPRIVERANYLLSRLPSSTDPHLSHTAIFPYHLGVLVHILIVYYIPHHSLISPFLYTVLSFSLPIAC
jgi:hypothetical protein